MDIKTCYLCDIENNNRNPLSFGKMCVLANILRLDVVGMARMYDLAAEKSKDAPMDLIEYIMSKEHLRELLRVTRDKNLKDDYY